MTFSEQLCLPFDSLADKPSCFKGWHGVPFCWRQTCLQVCSDVGWHADTSQHSACEELDIPWDLLGSPSGCTAPHLPQNTGRVCTVAGRRQSQSACISQVSPREVAGCTQLDLQLPCPLQACHLVIQGLGSVESFHNEWCCLVHGDHHSLATATLLNVAGEWHSHASPYVQCLTHLTKVQVHSMSECEYTLSLLV